ncbi:hypothetical protein N7468_004770 [Penicillium chermesinum]|uniref:Uncharacterized protein n=1 Tax=Penicillium chermesinum TaxID=63820 RepID=A0A9W9P8Y8_9EURO|nr:uncharacterized protein N7468_004770 [Penicillium chermesinum]KAJ5240151.1 hypothetical protein N7468_004770 [Penicillium chermesinum]
MTESLRDAAGDRKWPAIFFGDDAPLPRWKLVALANPPDADDLEHQLITTYDDKTHIPGVHRGSHPMSYDGKIGLGALDWELEYGPESGFNGFSKEEVYEVAFRCLVDATYDFLCREEIRAWISRQKWFHVANVDDPLPPIRHPPKLTLFGRARRKDSGVYFPNFEPLGKNGRLFDDFDRPTLCLDRGTNQTRPKSPSPSNQRRRPPRDPLIEMMLKNENTTLVAPGKVSSSFNPTHDSPQPQPPSSPVLPPKAGQPHSAALSNVERGSSGRSDRPQQGGRLAEICEYKCVSFSVILLILSMFICLFLYGFNIIN